MTFSFKSYVHTVYKQHWIVKVSGHFVGQGQFDPVMAYLTRFVEISEPTRNDPDPGY